MQTGSPADLAGGCKGPAGHRPIRRPAGIAHGHGMGRQGLQVRSQHLPCRFKRNDLIQQGLQVMCSGKGDPRGMKQGLHVLLSALLRVKAGGVIVGRLAGAQFAACGGEVAFRL